MDSTLLKNLRSKESLITNIAFYVCCSVLVVVIVAYLILFFKVSSQSQQVNALDTDIASREGSINTIEHSLLAYQKRISDYGLLINNHRITTEIFNFFEKKTLPNVQIIDLDMSQYVNQVRLAGETDNLESFSQQIQIFQESKDYVTRIDVLDVHSQSSATSHGVKFILSLSLNPSNFTYIKSAQGKKP